MPPSKVLFQSLFQSVHRPISLAVCDHYAGSESLMRKSLALQRMLNGAFDLTFDCEDGAAAGQEETHARMVGSLIASDDNQFSRVGVRVHDVNSPFFEQDIALISKPAAEKLTYIVLPKVASLAEVQCGIETINYHASVAGRASVPVHVLIETHGALADVRAIAALPQVECLSFGIMDFVSAHYGAIPASAMRTPEQFTHPLIVRAKLEIAAACHAYGKVPSHNVTTEIRDTAIVASDASRAMSEFAYTRMWSIHPDQIKPVLKSFAPRSSEINEAAQIISEALNADWGPVCHNGKLHDRASYRYYWTLLQRAKSSGAAIPEPVHLLLNMSSQ